MMNENESPVSIEEQISIAEQIEVLEAARGVLVSSFIGTSCTGL